MGILPRLLSRDAVLGRYTEVYPFPFVGDVAKILLIFCANGFSSTTVGRRGF